MGLWRLLLNIKHVKVTKLNVKGVTVEGILDGCKKISKRIRKNMECEKCPLERICETHCAEMWKKFFKMKLVPKDILED